MTEVVLSPGVIVERVGAELLVIVPGHTDVVKLTGGVAQVLENIRSGKAVDLSDPAVADLFELGIVSTPGVSRRGLIKAGAIGAGAGVAVLAMPGVAAASSTNWIEIRGFSYPFGGGTWGFEIQNSAGESGQSVGPGNPQLVPGIPIPVPTTDIDDVSDLSLYIGPNPPLVLPIDYSELVIGVNNPNTRSIGWYDGVKSTIDPGDQAIGEFTWDTPEGKLYYRVTFRKSWVGQT